jgi:phospho-N-acetylmuramoyl-pentapeptide-transferase
LYPLYKIYFPFNVFRYITFRTIYAILTALIILMVMGPWFIRKLKEKNVGQFISKNGPANHIKKEGTPTMGGALIIFAVAVSTFLWADLRKSAIWIIMFATISFGIIGFVDDYKKLIKGNSIGLKGRYKISFQLIVATIIALVLYILPNFNTYLSIPFLKGINPNLGLIDIGVLYIPFVVLVIVGASNAVNLTDGLDGLAIGPVIIASATYLIFAYVTGHKKIAEYLQIAYVSGAGELAIFCGAMIGASIGFLWYNAYPAQIFMGDVGSLALGGALGTVAVITKKEMLLLLVGGVFVIETLSVIFQVVSYKLRGKRIFRMAPLHHHFELKGWPEPKIIVRFWIISIILSLIAISTLKLR